MNRKITMRSQPDPHVTSAIVSDTPDLWEKDASRRQWLRRAIGVLGGAGILAAGQPRPVSAAQTSPETPLECLGPSAPVVGAAIASVAASTRVEGDSHD